MHSVNSIYWDNPVRKNCRFLGITWILAQVLLYVILLCLPKSWSKDLKLGIVLMGAALPVLLCILAAALKGISPILLLRGGSRNPELNGIMRRRMVIRHLPWSLCLIGFINIATGLIMEALGYEIPQQDLVTVLQKSGFVIRIILFVSSVFIAPVSEELFFRRFLPDCLEACKITPSLSIFLTSLCFAAVHNLAVCLPAFTLMSILLFKARDRQDLLTSIIFHSAYNAVIFLVTITAD